MFDVVTSFSLWELVKHTVSWVANLKRASAARKKESRAALQQVIIAARKTAVYTRELQDTGRHSYDKEAELAELWTELSFTLSDLKLEKLAKRCSAIGKHWTDPEKLDKHYLEKADAGLERLEYLASGILDEI